MMTTNSNRKLAKGFWPVLLLSAALSLPAASVAAPSPNGKAAAGDKHDKNKGRNQVRKELQKNQRQAAKQRTEIRRDAQKQRVEVRRDTQKRQAEIRREADRRRQAEVRYQSQRQAQERQLNLQRQAQHQRQLELQRNIERQRQAEFYRQQQRNRSSSRYNDRYVQNNRYRDDNYYRNRFGRYTYRNNGYQEHLDGFVVDDRGECVLFREHRTGQIFALAGNIDDMREGDHIRYVGTHTYDEYCDSGYPTMNVREIKTVWSNDRHENALFDTNRHGSYDRWADNYYGY